MRQVSLPHLQCRIHNFVTWGGRIGGVVWEERCDGIFYLQFYAEIMHFCAKFLLGYKMRPVNKGVRQLPL